MILGPLLFLMYTNEMSEAIKSPDCPENVHQDNTTLFGKNCKICGLLVIYAYDATYQVSNRHRNDNQTKITENLERLEDFLRDNELAVNIGKTAVLEAMIKQKKGRTPDVLESLG